MKMSNKKIGNSLGERIKYFRGEAGLSQQDLADALDYKSGTAISLIESGARGVGAEDVKHFAKALGVKASVLLGEDMDVPDFSTALRADAELSKKDKNDILDFYNYVKKGRK